MNANNPVNIYFYFFEDNLYALLKNNMFKLCNYNVIVLLVIDWLKIINMNIKFIRQS